MRTLWLLVAFLLPLSARAGEEDFQRFYNAALRLHESLEYERALEQLELARKQAATSQQMSMVSLAEGVVLTDLNKPTEAMAAFKAGLLLASDAKLPLKVAPRVAAEVEALRVKVKQELAPLLAKQEAERQKAEAEAKALAAARAEAEAKRAEAERQKADAETKAREAQRQEDEKRKADADAKAKEAARLLAEAEARLKELSRLEAERKAALAADAPKQVVILPPDAPTLVEPPLLPAPVPSRAPMVLTFVFLGAGAVAAAVGGFYGVQSQGQVQQARDAAFQDEAQRALQSAGQSATLANVLFGVGGAMGVGALVSGIAWGSQPAPRPPPAAEGSAP